MTLVIGVRTKEGCVLIADSAATSEKGGEIDTYINPRKLHYLHAPNRHGQILTAFSGSIRFGQLLTHVRPFHDSSGRTVQASLTAFDNDPYDWTVRYWVAAALSYTRHHGLETSDEHGSHSGEYHLVAIRDRIFYVNDDWHVAEVATPYVAIGVAAVYAFAALRLAFWGTDEVTKNVGERKLAIVSGAVEHHCIFVRRPFCVAHTHLNSSKSRPEVNEVPDEWLRP